MSNLNSYKARMFVWFAKHPELVASPITGFVSLAVVILSLLLVSPPLDILEPTSIGSILPMWQEILWAIMLAAGGVLSLVGLVAPSKAADVYGTLLLAGTLLIDAVTIWAYRGWDAGSITGGFLAALAFGLIARAIVVAWISSVLAQTGGQAAR